MSIGITIVIVKDSQPVVDKKVHNFRQSSFNQFHVCIGSINISVYLPNDTSPHMDFKRSTPRQPNQTHQS